MEKKEKVLEFSLLVSAIKPGSKRAWSYDDCRYRILATSMSNEDAEIAMGMRRRFPLTKEEVAANCGKDVELVHKTLLRLADVGVCFRAWYNEDGTDALSLGKSGIEKFYFEPYVPGIMEQMVNNVENVKKHPEIAVCFEEYGRVAGPMSVGKFPVGIGLMRVIPIQSAIDGNTQAKSYEQISHYIEDEKMFSVSPCSCRTSREVMGEGCGHLKEDMCIQLGRAAEYYITTGRGRQVTKEEVYEILDKAEKNGLMHNIPNMEGVGHTHAICNCCGCSCFAIRSSNLLKNVDMCRSNYVAKVDEEKCVACGQCTENCPINAVRLGQKICSTNEIKEFKEEKTPRTYEFTEKDFNFEFRTTKETTVPEGTSPCKVECPAHIGVQGYIRHASQKNYAEALKLIKKHNPLPAVCGRICPHNCEAACTRNGFDEPLAIDEIKKFIADRELNSEERYIPRIKNPEYAVKKMAVIGSGPAGLSCAYYLAEKGYSVTVFEKESVLGGMLTLGIPTFRLEKDVINAEIDILREMGVEFKTNHKLGKDMTVTSLRKDGYEAFYLAIGACGTRKLNLNGEEAKGVYYGVDFVKEVNLGNLKSLKGDTIVIGGGNVAIDVARNAVRINEDSVSMYCLESREEMPAIEEEIDEALEENISINNSYGPVEILTEKGKVSGVVFKKCLSVFDENGAFNPKYDEKDLITVPCKNVIISIGQSVETENMLQDTAVEFNKNGTVKAHHFTYQTAEKDIFTGGDCYSGPSFAIDAIAAGKEAAESMHRVVWPGQDMFIGRFQKPYISLDVDSVVFEGFDNMKRQRPAHEKMAQFKDGRQTFTEEQMLKETERCLGCGAAKVNEFMCVGCGQCTTRCDFEAIKLERVYDGENVTLEEAKPHVIKTTIKRKFKIQGQKIVDTFKSAK